MQLLDGKALSHEIHQQIAFDITARKEAGKKIPLLAAVLVGNDGGSETYVASKIKTCEKVGMGSRLFRFDEKVTEAELLDLINRLNEDNDVSGILVQLPLPKDIDDAKIINAVTPRKDVDGFHPLNTGRMMKGLPCHLPATPKGIMLLLDRFNVETEGKHCVVIGRSDIVGRPMSVLMSQSGKPGNATVTLTHSKTKNLRDFTHQADIVIAALGKPEFLKADMVKDGVVIIDVGTTRVPDATRKTGFRLAGDVDFKNVAPKCSWITPVPGGVGPMTIASLMLNTLQSTELEF